MEAVNSKNRTIDTSRTYSIVRAKIQTYFKDIGLYQITLLEKALVSRGLSLAVDMFGTSPSGTGASVDSAVYTPGTVVFILLPSLLSQNQDSRPSPYSIILGADNIYGKRDTAHHPLWSMSANQDEDNEDAITGMEDAARKAIAQVCEINRLGDHAGGPPLDTCSGTWIAHNPYKGHLVLSNERVSISGNHMNGLHFFTGNDTCIFNTGARYLQESYPYRRTIYPDGEGFTEVNSYAVTAANALGAYQSIEDVIDPSDMKIKNKEILPIWRHQQIKGLSVNGQLEYINLPVKDTGVNTKDNEDSNKAVIFDYKGYDGVRTSSAAHSTSISRDPALVTISQLEDEFGLETIPVSETEPIEDTHTSLEGEVADNATQYAGLMYELMKRKFVERYLPKLKERKDNWAVATAEEICNKILNLESTDASLPNLDENAPCYPSSSTDTVTTKDPVTGNDIKSSASPNYFHLDPSGAVVISDGHGSEIRMEGGNITITCPGDFKVLPGRDTTILSPRDTSIVSQRRIDIASDKDEVTIKGEKEVNIAAIDGALTLEGRKTAPSTAVTEEDRAGHNTGGVIIRSASTLAMVGKHLRIGVQSPDDTSQEGREDTTGTIVVDAGKGAVSVMGSSAYVSGEQYAGLTSKRSMVSVTGSSVGIGSNTIDLSASYVGIGGSAISSTAPEMKSSGMESNTISPSGSSQTTVSLSGNLFVAKSLGAETVLSSMVRTRRLGANNGSKLSGVRATGAVAPLWTTGGKGIQSSSAQAYKTSSETGIQTSKQTISSDKLFTAAGTMAPGLYYLKSDDYGCGEEYFLVNSRWQRKLEEGGGGHKWKFKPVKYPLTNTEGLPKPGLEALTERNIIKKANIQNGELIVTDSSFADGYITNARSTS